MQLSHDLARQINGKSLESDGGMFDQWVRGVELFHRAHLDTRTERK